MKIKSTFAGNIRLQAGPEFIDFKSGETHELNEDQAKAYASQVNRYLQEGRLEVILEEEKKEIVKESEVSEEIKEDVKVESNEADKANEVRKEIRKLQAAYKRSKSSEEKADIKSKVSTLKKELSTLRK